MKFKIITTIAIFSFFLSCQPASGQESGTTIFENPSQYQGEWELYQVKKSGKLISADSLNECGYKELIYIDAEQEPYSLNRGNFKFDGFQIGQTKMNACTFDPETFENVVHQNSCYNIFIASDKNPDIWYEVGEGALIKYKVFREADSLIFELRKAIIHYDEYYTKMIFKRP